MNIETLRQYCLDKPAVSESFPFDRDTLVFKVGQKVFALMNLESDPLKINLKCDPDKAIALRAQYWQITPGYHMNKKHWNTISIEGHLAPGLIQDLIDHSYESVLQSMSLKERNTIRNK